MSDNKRPAWACPLRTRLLVCTQPRLCVFLIWGCLPALHVTRLVYTIIGLSSLSFLYPPSSDSFLFGRVAQSEDPRQPLYLSPKTSPYWQEGEEQMKRKRVAITAEIRRRKLRRHRAWEVISNRFPRYFAVDICFVICPPFSGLVGTWICIRSGVSTWRI